MLRAIREVQPKWVVGENVLGLVNWNGGLVFDEVQSDLEAEGYEVQAYVLPACAVNAPHRRDRVWIIAHSNGANKGDNYRTDIETEGEIRRRKESDVFDEFCSNGDVANPTSQPSERMRPEQRNFSQQEQGEFGGNSSGMGSEWDAADTTSLRQPRKEHGETKSGRATKTGLPDDWSNFPTQSPICQRNDGISGRLSGITFPKWRNESIKAMGNAIVPQVVYQIFKSIEQYESLNTNNQNEPKNY